MMIKHLFVFSIIVGLTACGGEDDRLNLKSQDETTDLLTLYSFDAYTPIYLQPKIYNINNDQEFELQYGVIPTSLSIEPLKMEALRGYVTQDSISNILPPLKAEKSYLIGEEAHWDGHFLEYKPSNYSSKNRITLKYELTKKDISGQYIGNYFIHQFRKSAGINLKVIEIYWAILGIGTSSMGTFPKGSTCWQKKSALSNQDYIEFYPPSSIPYLYVSDLTPIESSGDWNNVKWIQYGADNSLYDANIKLEYKDKTMWGFYHHEKEDFSYAPNDIICEFLNETAYHAVKESTDKIVTEFESTGK